jgi:hypothetical protein
MANETKKLERLLRISEEEFDRIPDDKKITAKVEGVEEDAVYESCPMDKANACVLKYRWSRPCSYFCGEQIFNDSFESDIARVKRRFGISASTPVETHGIGIVDHYTVIYVAVLDDKILTDIIEERSKKR